VATNTTDNDSSSSLISTINPVKHLSQVFTQADDWQVDVKTNRTALSEENDNTNSNLKYNDSQKISDKQKEHVEWIVETAWPCFLVTIIA
jgi:hypothetical protein